MLTHAASDFPPTCYNEKTTSSTASIVWEKTAFWSSMTIQTTER